MGTWKKHTIEVAPKTPIRSETGTMVAVTLPTRWGFEAVRSVFGVIRPTGSDVVIAGDLLRHMESGKLYVFEKRTDDCIVVEEA